MQVINKGGRVVKDKKDGIITAAKGLVVGSTMLVPGVSGGSMAMILGIYDRLIQSVSSFFKNIKGNLIFLIEFAAAALLGMFLFAKPLEALIGAYEKPMMYFFIGVVLGGCPLIFKEAGVGGFSLKAVIYLVLGAGVVTSLTFLPENLFASASGGVEGFLIQFFGGVVISIALILPGISVTYMLLVLGLYQGVLSAIGNLDVLYLLPLALGLVAGILLLTKALEGAMKHFPQPTYMIILGFVLGSVGQVFPGVPTGIDIPVCLALAVVGFVLIYFLSKLEERKTKPEAVEAAESNAQ